EVAGIRDDLDQFGAPAALGGMWLVTRVERGGLVERETHAELAGHREDATAIAFARRPLLGGQVGAGPFVGRGRGPRKRFRLRGAVAIGRSAGAAAEQGKGGDERKQVTHDELLWLTICWRTEGKQRYRRQVATTRLAGGTVR